jgi:hypothetical protein
MTFATLISFILGATLDIILLSYGARCWRSACWPPSSAPAL